ncbi:MAG: metallophosphoesterase [Verrucomicrobiales bacterium]
MKEQGYDFIADIHGHCDKLTELLEKLGYRRRNGTFRHADGRQVVFLGDYIDRGPQVREVLQTVRAMCEAGDALAIMGNHEFNAICFATDDGRGGHLRQHSEKNLRQHAATLCQFEGKDSEWQEWQHWMKTLDFSLDLGGARAVHACWDRQSIELLGGRKCTDDEFLSAAAASGTAENRAMKLLLSGPEIRLPDGMHYLDKEKTHRQTVRVRWWELPEQASAGELTMPTPIDVPSPLPGDILRALPSYPPDDPPVFFGHYWLPSESTPGPLAKNIVCLDYSAGLTGPLTAYRWNGERCPASRSFVGTRLKKSEHHPPPADRQVSEPPENICLSLNT